MFLTVNHSESNNNSNNREFTPIAEGDYQAIIKEAEVTKSSSGNNMIKVTVVIRDDVRQQFAKRKLWDYIVDSDKAKWKFNQVAKAVKIQDGKQISSIQEFAKEILYKPVTITIKHKEETYNGENKTRDYISQYTVAQVEQNTATNPFSTPSSNNISPF